MNKTLCAHYIVNMKNDDVKKTIIVYKKQSISYEK